MASSSGFVRRTTLVLASSLLLIAALAGAEWLLSERMVDDQRTSATEINVAGRQRMLSQRISVLASSTAAAPDRGFREAGMAALAETADELRASHAALRNGDPARGLGGNLSAEADAIHTAEPYRVNERLDELLAEVDGFLVSGTDTQYLHLTEIRRITADDSDTSLLRGLNEFVRVLETESNEATEAMGRASQAVLAAVLVVLTLIWFFAFRPMLRQLTSTLDDLEAARAEHDRLAHEDELTGLPNRRGFGRLVEALGDTSVATIMLDLDGFKEVNDTLGHAAGDELLVELARRFDTAKLDGEIIARLGGDEFAFVTAGDDEAAVHERAGQLITLAAQPVTIDDSLAVVGASAGFHVGPAHDHDELLSAADTALYAAKEAGRARVVRFETSMRDVQVHDFELSAEIRRAVDQHEFSNRYQPIVDLPTGEIRGVETLIRWNHPRLGLVGPDRFMPLVRRDDSMLHAVTVGVLREALLDAAVFRRHRPDLTVSVNFPGRLVNAEFLFYVERLLDHAGLPGSALTVEITEHELVLADAGPVLDSYAELGIRVAIDDYGTGYCSLARLHTLTVDHLKLDQQFVRDADGQTGAVARAVAGIAAELELTVVAEGIETAEQADAMRELGFELGQGHLWSPGLAAGDLEQQLRAVAVSRS